MALTNAERTKKYREANKEKVKLATKLWIKTNKEKYKLMKRKNALRKYGLDLDKYDAIFEKQNKACAICKCTKSASSKNWHIDHCHKTKKVRGILCAHCNRMLGAARDNKEYLLEAIKYLEKDEFYSIVSINFKNYRDSRKKNNWSSEWP